MDEIGRTLLKLRASPWTFVFDAALTPTAASADHTHDVRPDRLGARAEGSERQRHAPIMLPALHRVHPRWRGDRVGDTLGR